MSAVPELATLTADLADALGIPVFVWCLACAHPSRALDLQAIRDRGLSDRPIADLAQAGRFRCTRCRSRRLDIMPTLDILVVQRRRLRISCERCGRDQALTAKAAVERFGLAMPFDQLRRSLRCRSSCGVSAGSMLPVEAIAQSSRPFFSADDKPRT